MADKHNYKMYYFNARGRAEPTRLVLAAAGVKFEDIRFKDRDDWQNNYKKLSPTGQSPFMEVDGKMMGQSWAMARYVAREHDLYGSNAWEGAMIDQVIYTIEDLSKPFTEWHFELDAEKKEEKMKTLTETTVPQFLGRLENLLKQNNDGKGFFIGDKLSLADTVVFGAIENMKKTMPNCTDKLPTLAAHFDLVKSDPKIAAWLSERPDTQF